jgi:hypothetical protein
MSTLALISALAAQTASQAATPPASASPVPPALATAPEARRGSSTYLDLEGGVGYSTNPLLEFGGHTAAGYGRVSGHAVHTRVSERTTTVFSALAQNLFYTSHHGSQQLFDFSARHDARVSEKLQLFGDADLYYDKGGQLGTRIVDLPNVPPPPGVTQPPVLLPPGSDFFSITGRQYRASAHVGGQVALSTHDFLTVTSGIDHSIFKSGSIDTRYTTIPVSIGYQRQISAVTTAGARVVAEHTDYNGPTSFNVITPQLTMQSALSERMTFSADVGVSFASIDNGISTSHSTGLAADASLCSRGETSQFCARGSIDQQAATVAGPARTETIGVDYSRQLDANQTIQIAFNASQFSAPISVITGRTFSRSTYVRAAADYTRRLSDRWFGGVSLSARKVSERGPDPRVDVDGALFIRYRLGDIR